MDMNQLTNQLNSHPYHYKHYEVMNDEDDDDLRKKGKRRKKMLTGVSKQRRAANERERKRLQIINKAYKELKAALPLFPNEDNIPKIKIVQLATRTIQDLSDILNNENNHQGCSSRDRMDSSTSNGELSSDMSASSPDGSENSLEDLPPYIKQEPFEYQEPYEYKEPYKTEFSNILIPNNNDLKLDFDSTFPSLDIDDAIFNSPDCFRGLDLSFFIGGTSSTNC